MSVRVTVECAQCGQEAPADPAELETWRHGDIVLSDELDEVTASLVLCPDCDAEDRHGEFEAGDAG
jgi:hypothetical protein